MNKREHQVSVSPQIKSTDFKLIAESIIDEWKARVDRRKDLRKHWDEVDRQLRMEPELSHKKLADGKLDSRRAWLPEIELPLQAQTLEVLMSDVRRLLFPHNRDFFTARAALTAQYLDRFGRAGSPFPGERAAKGEGPRSEMNQDNADRLAQATLAHWHSLYDFRAHMDVINAQSISYGFGVGRLRKVMRRILGYDARVGGPINQRIPVVVPRDARKVYLDDNVYSVMHEGHVLGPNIIQERTVKHADFKAAAVAGESDPKSEEGGYVLNEINKLEPKKGGTIDLVELEGDLVIDRSDETIIIRDVIVTAAIGGTKTGSKESSAFVRYREGEKFSTYQIHHYHLEGPSFVSGAAPLLKGMPVARLAAQCMNRIVEAGLLKNSPPIAYDKSDTALALQGGPIIEPYAQWPTADLNAIKAQIEVGGEPAVLFQIFTGLVSLYADMTGVNAPRLGAQTKSHTTAFAKDVEISRGAARTVDFTNSILNGPMSRMLHLEYRMGLSAMRGRHTIYVQPWDEFVTITRQHLPEIVRFQAVGSGAPAEDEVKSQQKLSSAQLALQIDQFSQELGNPPQIDAAKLIEHVLNAGGWDVSEISTTGTGETPGAVEQQLPGAITGEPGALEL